MVISAVPIDLIIPNDVFPPATDAVTNDGLLERAVLIEHYHHRYH